MFLLMIGGSHCGEPEENRSFEQPYKLFEDLNEAISAADTWVKESAERESFPGTDIFGYLNSYYYSFTARVIDMEEVNPTIVYTSWSDIEFINDENSTKNLVLSHTDERVEYPHRP